MSKKGFIFDLDGVIVDTAKYHFLAWKKLSNSFGIDFNEEMNEELKGISRVRSFQKILEWGKITLDDDHFMEYIAKKNNDYLEYIDAMGEEEILPNVVETLDYLIAKGQPIALGSASKNARRILEKLNLLNKFNTIVDGNDVSKAKPNPEVFLKASEQINISPKNCIVFEDSIAGIKAANSANMLSVGIGDQETLSESDYVFKDFSKMPPNFLEKIIVN